MEKISFRIYIFIFSYHIHILLKCLFSEYLSSNPRQGELSQLVVELCRDMRKFMSEEGFQEIYVFIPSVSCGQISNPTGKFPIKVIKQKRHRRIQPDVLSQVYFKKYKIRSNSGSEKV